ncbi:hypothetical protein GGF32_000138 [Allomyces javanicus]|nr:hypothetical protein GGF32_000138 [Allomyces javanicus]
MANFLNTRWLRDDVLAAAREGLYVLHPDATVILGFDRYPADVTNLHSATFTASDGAHTIHARLTESAATSLVQGESQFALVDLQNLLITVTDYDLVWSHAPRLDATRNDLSICIHCVAEAHFLHHTVGSPVPLLAIGLVKTALMELFTMRIQPALDALRPATPAPDVEMADLSPPTPPASDAADVDDDPMPAPTLTPCGPWPPPAPLLSDSACWIPAEQLCLLEQILWPPPSLSSGACGPSTTPTPSAAVTGTPPSPISSVTEDGDNMGQLFAPLPPATSATVAPAPETPARPPLAPRPTSPSPCLVPLHNSLDGLLPCSQSAASPTASSVTLSLTVRSVVPGDSNGHEATPLRALSVPVHAQVDISPALTLPSLGPSSVSPPLPHAPAVLAVQQETSQPSGTTISSSASSTQSHAPQPDAPAGQDGPDPAVAPSPPAPPAATFVDPVPDTQVLARGVWFAVSPDWSSLDGGLDAVDTQADDVQFDLFTQPYRDYHASRHGSEDPLSDRISFGDDTDSSDDSDERLMDVASLDLEGLFAGPSPRPASDTDPDEVAVPSSGTADGSLMSAASGGARDPVPSSVPDVSEPLRVLQETTADVGDAACVDPGRAPSERVVTPSPMVVGALAPEIVADCNTATSALPDSDPSSVILDTSAASQDPAHDHCDPSPGMGPASDVDPKPDSPIDTTGSPASSSAILLTRSGDDDADENAMLLDAPPTPPPPPPPLLPSPPVMTIMSSGADDENDAHLDSPMPPSPALPPPPILAVAPFPFIPNPIPPSQSSRSSSVDDLLDEPAERGGERAVLSMKLLSSPAQSPALPPVSSPSPPRVSPAPAPAPPPLPRSSPPHMPPPPPPPKRQRRQVVLILPRVPRSVLARCRIGATSAATAADAPLYVPSPDRSERPPPLVVYLPPPRLVVPPATPAVQEDVEANVPEQGSSSPDVMRPRKRRRRFFFLSQESEDSA